MARKRGNCVRVMLVGDVVGRPGRRAVQELLSGLRSEQKLDFVIVNCENAAAGFGITAGLADELLEAGADCLTSGNHIWAQKGTEQVLQRERRLLRPANYPPQCPGRGSGVYEACDGTRVGVLNLQGRVFMGELDCPFRTADAEIEYICEDGADLIVVDFHAEATSEKMALGQYLDGRVAAVIGTHTHVMTADEQILPGGTAYLTDVGMTGPTQGTIIGMQSAEILQRFITLMPQRFQVRKQGEARFSAVVFEYSLDTRRSKRIKRLERCITVGEGSAP